MGAWALAQWMLGSTVPGWTSVIVIVAFLSSVQLLCLGVLGEYIGRLFMESKHRPLAIIREVRSRAGTPVTALRQNAASVR